MNVYVITLHFHCQNKSLLEISALPLKIFTLYFYFRAIRSSICVLFILIQELFTSTRGGGARDSRWMEMRRAEGKGGR